MTDKQPTIIDNATGLVLNELPEEQLASQAITELFTDEQQAQQTVNIIAVFVNSYSRNKDKLPLEIWLEQEFANYPDIWANDNERKETALEIIETIQRNNAAKTDLEAHLQKSKSRESWLAKKIEQGTSSVGVVNVGEYAQQIDNALAEANKNFLNTITRKDGVISQALNLDGFIAEQHHVNSFNIDAAAKGSPYRAKVLEPEGTRYGKNSMDIGIYDADGKLVRRYQSKYGMDAEATAELFEKGDYRGQRKLVPEGHADANSSEVIEIDGVSSKPLSKEEAKALQQKAQLEAEIKKYDWNDANRMIIAKEIGKKALVSAAFNAGFQGTRILGRRIWNSLTGKENRSANEDMQEFFTYSLSSAKNVGVQVAVSGGLVVAAKSGWIKVLKNTPAGKIADIAYVALENAKCLYQLAKGEITAIEAMDAMGNTTCTLVGGLAGAGKGATLGLALGGPVTAFIGAVVGGIGGSVMGDAVYQGGKKILKTAAKVVESAYEGTKTVAKSVFNTLTFGLFA